jgi:hypothetical protein
MEVSLTHDYPQKERPDSSLFQPRRVPLPPRSEISFQIAAYPPNLPWCVQFSPDAVLLAKNFELKQWTFNPTTGNLSPQWINTDSCEFCIRVNPLMTSSPGPFQLPPPLSSSPESEHSTSLEMLPHGLASTRRHQTFDMSVPGVPYSCPLLIDLNRLFNSKTPPFDLLLFFKRTRRRPPCSGHSQRTSFS